MAVACANAKPQILCGQQSYDDNNTACLSTILDDSTACAPSAMNPKPTGSFTKDASDYMALQNGEELPEINKTVEFLQNHELSYSIQMETAAAVEMPNAVSQTEHNESVDYDFDSLNLSPTFGMMNDMDVSRRSESSECKPDESIEKQESTTRGKDSQNEPARGKRNDSLAHETQKGRSIQTVSETEFGMNSSSEEDTSSDGLCKNIQDNCARLEVSILDELYPLICDYVLFRNAAKRYIKVNEIQKTNSIYIIFRRDR